MNKNLENLAFSRFLWSKCGGSNSGPHGPEPCALPAALHLDFGKILSFFASGQVCGQSEILRKILKR